MFGPSSMFSGAFEPFGPRQGRFVDPFEHMHRVMDEMMNEPFMTGAGLHSQWPHQAMLQVRYLPCFLEAFCKP